MSIKEGWYVLVYRHSIVVSSKQAPAKHRFSLNFEKSRQKSKCSKTLLNLVKHVFMCFPMFSRSKFDFGITKKHTKIFELNSKTEKAMLNNYNNNLILLLPKTSELKKMKQHCHVKTNLFKFFKEHLSKPANW